MGVHIMLKSLNILNEPLETASPQDILKHAVATFGDKLVVVTSFQPTGIITLHMLQDIAPETPVITIDTDLLFPETYALIDEIEARFHLNLTRVQAKQTLAEQAQTYGDALWEKQPDTCCNLRKVVPLKEALCGYDAWLSGLRRDQSPTRSNTPIVGWDKRNEGYKYCPFATWTEDMIWQYIYVHHLPYNDLHRRGYPSIGCYPCTEAVVAGGDIRAGRWINQNKTECGIHLG